MFHLSTPEKVRYRKRKVGPNGLDQKESNIVSVVIDISLKSGKRYDENIS